MKIRPTLLALSIITLLIGTSASAQPFQKTLTDPNDVDHDRSSIVRHENNSGILQGYVVAATRTYKNPDDNISDCVISYLDTDGKLQWSASLDFEPIDVCMDVDINYEGNIMIVGYTGKTNTSVNVLVAELSINDGAVLKSRELSSEDHDCSIGLTIDCDATSDFCVIGGTYSGALWGRVVTTSTSTAGFVTRLEANLEDSWTKEYTAVRDRMNVVNDVLLTPSSVFVTGSYGASSTTAEGGLAAFMLNKHTGSLIWDLSNHYDQHFSHTGANAVYDPSNNGTVYLLSNYAPHFPRNDGFEIMRIENADNTSASIVNTFAFTPTPIFGNDNPVGLSLFMDEEELIVGGMFEHYNHQVSNGHAPTFLVGFNKTTGAVTTAPKVYEAASFGYCQLAWGSLSPYGIFLNYTPSHMVKNNEGGYMMLGHRLIGSFAIPQVDPYYTEILNTDGEFDTHTDCQGTFAGQTGTTPARIMNPLDLVKASPESGVIEGNKEEIYLELEEHCPVGGELRMAVAEPHVHPESVTVLPASTSDLQVTPNPSFSGRFTLQINGLGDEKNIRVITIEGKVVLEESMIGDQSTIDLSSFGTGTYLVYVNDGISMAKQTIIFQ